MSSQLHVGTKAPGDILKARWLQHNITMGRKVKVLQSSYKNGCRFLSVCCTANTKGWRKSDSGCRAHMNFTGATPDQCEIVSCDIRHTCEAESNKRKRNYNFKDMATVSDALKLYQPTSKKEGNAQQIADIAKASTGIEMRTGQAYRVVHERSNDTVAAQIGQYMLLPSLFALLKEEDQYGSFELESENSNWDEDVQQFKRAYICLSFQKLFWQRAHIQMIVIDGTHTKLSDFKHILLIAVTFDGNNQIFILAFAIVDVEDQDNWVWFHEHLKQDFPCFEVLMSDADKGITSAAFQMSQEEVEALTSRCARHLADNCREASSYRMNEGHKLMILSLAKARTEQSYLERLQAIRDVHPEWAEWLDRRKYEFVTYTFLDRNVKRWGKVTSNAVENVNSSILDVRQLPILFLVLGMIHKIQQKYMEGYKQALTWRERNQDVTDYASKEHEIRLKN